MTSEDTPPPLSLASLRLGRSRPSSAEKPHISGSAWCSSRAGTSNPSGCTIAGRYGDGTKRPASVAASAAYLPGPRARLLRTSLLRGMAVRGRPATRPHRRTGALPYLRDPGGRYPIASLRRGRDRSTAPNPDSRPPKCRSARGADSRPRPRTASVLREEVGADRELSKSDGCTCVARETGQVALLESDPADRVSEGHRLLRQPRKRRQRPEFDISPEVVQGVAQPRARNRLQRFQQRRKLPDNVLLSQSGAPTPGAAGDPISFPSPPRCQREGELRHENGDVRDLQSRCPGAHHAISRCHHFPRAKSGESR
jgi:hypothetical protein